jgi:hypothetical protein
MPMLAVITLSRPPRTIGCATEEDADPPAGPLGPGQRLLEPVER